MASKEVPSLLLKLYRLNHKDITDKNTSLSVINEFYKTVRKPPSTHSPEMRVTSENFPLIDQQTADNCGRASTSAALRVACSLHDLDTTHAYQKVGGTQSKETLPTGPFKAYKHLNQRVLEKYGDTQSEDLKRISHSLDKLIEESSKNPKKACRQIPDWYNRHMTQPLPDSKRLRLLVQLETLTSVVAEKTHDKLQLTEQKKQVEEKKYHDLHQKQKALKAEKKSKQKQGLSDPVLKDYNRRLKQLETERLPIQEKLHTLNRQIQELNHMREELETFNTLADIDGQIYDLELSMSVGDGL